MKITVDRSSISTSGRELRIFKNFGIFDKVVTFFPSIEFRLTSLIGRGLHQLHVCKISEKFIEEFSRKLSLNFFFNVQIVARVTISGAPCRPQHDSWRQTL